VKIVSRPFALGLGLIVFLLNGACGGALRPWSIFQAQEDPYQTLNAPQLARLRRGIVSFEAGALSEAQGQFEQLVEIRPKDLAAAVWYQELRLALREKRNARFDEIGGSSRGAQAELRDSYRAEAEARPTAMAYYLAARLEGDFLAANLLLRKALELDPKMAWAHYGMAYGAAREGEWALAREHLTLGFELQPNHLPSIRLFGWLQAQVGDVESAVTAFEAWTEQAEEDAFAGQGTLDRVRFDLALAYTSEESWSAALEILEQLEESTVKASDRWASVAVAYQGRGELEEAHEALLAGRQADPYALLPAVQNAMLLELWMEDREGALRAWRKVLELAIANDGLDSILQQFRAEIHLQRLERTRENLP
jgi:tetratricopeptide (TPR) repeat protein